MRNKPFSFPLTLEFIFHLLFSFPQSFLSSNFVSFFFYASSRTVVLPLFPSSGIAFARAPPIINQPASQSLTHSFIHDSRPEPTPIHQIHQYQPFVTTRRHLGSKRLVCPSSHPPRLPFATGLSSGLPSHKKHDSVIRANHGKRTLIKSSLLIKLIRDN